MDDIILNERDYRRLIESRNAFASTLAALVELHAAGDQSVQAAEMIRVLAIAKSQLDQYGQHAAFVVS